MSAKARRWLAERLPERFVYELVLVRNGETGRQQALRRALADARERLWRLRHGHKSASDPLGVRAVMPRVVDHFDAAQIAQDNVDAVSAALEGRGVDHVLVPLAATAGRRVAVSAEDADKAVDAIVSALTDAEWGIAYTTVSGRALHRRHVVRLSAVTSQTLAGTSGFQVFRRLDGANGEPVAGLDLACHVDLWNPVDTEGVRRSDGGTFPIGTRRSPVPRETIVGYLSPATWTAATLSPSHWPRDAARRTLFQVREPIDIVYTWVDGADPAWSARKAEFAEREPGRSRNGSATHDSRYASSDELKYSLRSVAMFASWVNRIYIVTDKQVPDWLDTTHPKIQLVSHEEIFTDPSVLPVFNSHAIESQLHHIPGLSEHYLYLNDDVFFGRPVEPELFFHGNGVAKFFLSKATLDIDPPSSADLPVMSAAKRNRALLAERFDATVIHKFRHTPHTQLRSVLEQMEREYPEIFAAVARSRFRHPDDLSITSALHHYYAYGIGRSMPDDVRYTYQDIARADTPRRLANLLRTRDVDCICLNDHETRPEIRARQRKVLHSFFERYFPVPSPFERPDAAAD